MVGLNNANTLTAHALWYAIDKYVHTHRLHGYVIDDETSKTVLLRIAAVYKLILKVSKHHYRLMLVNNLLTNLSKLATYSLSRVCNHS